MKLRLLFLSILFCWINYCAGQPKRDPWLWPFAQNSIWNMPIGSNAVYVNANIGLAGFVGVDDEYMYIVPEGSPERNIYGPHTWNDRCPIEDADKYQGKMQIPDDLLMPDATGSETPNNVATFLQPGGSAVISLAPFTRCTAGGTVFGWKRPDLDIKGEGITGAHWGSGLSGFGGSIRKGELQGSEPIRHALKIDIWGQKYLYYASDRLGYRWPADRADNYAAETWGYMRQDPQLGNPNKAIVQGSLLAIPPSVTEASLNLVTPPAKKIFKALQDYGAYIVDDAAWDAHYICAEKGVKEETEAQYGIGMHGYSGDFHDDINKLMQALKVVDNNASDNIGGGGVPRAPLAPAFIDTPPTGTKVKIMPLGNSLTHGENGSPSYRGPLRKMLIQNGYINIDFVGPKNDESPGDAIPADGDHAGYAGFTIGPTNLGYSIMQSIDNIMTYDPDIILLEIGINDSWNDNNQHGPDYQQTADDRYENLIKKIIGLKPGVIILVASLVPVKWDLNWSNSDTRSDLNQRIASLPSKYPNVVFVDMFEKMKAAIDVISDYRDDIHLSESGSSKMADVWFKEIKNHVVVSGPSSEPAPSLPGKVQAEKFTIMSGVQTEATTDKEGGSEVMSIETGDWMDYSVNVNSDTKFIFTFRVSAAQAGGQIVIRKGSVAFDTIAVPATGSPEKWTKVYGAGTLSAGKHTLRLLALTGGWSINWFEASNYVVPSSVLLNPGFEQSSPTSTPPGWIESGNTDCSFTEVGSGSHEGTYHLTHWSGSAYEVSTSQTLSGLQNGLYNLTAYVMSGGGQTDCQIRAKDFIGDTIVFVNVPVASNFTKVQITNIEVTNGQCIIELYSKSSGNQWAVFDLISFSQKTTTLTQVNDVLHKLKVYPIPFSQSCFIETQEFKSPVLSVYNFQGKIVYQRTLKSSKEHILLQSLPSGVYIFSVSDGVRTKHEKVILE